MSPNSTPAAPDSPLPLDAWTVSLAAVASQPLAFCPDFPRIAARHEAFWQGTLAYPLLIAPVNTNPARPITRRLDLLFDPAAWFAAKMQDLQQTYRIADSLPFIRADFGAVMLGGLFGAPVEFQSDTTWTHKIINDDWSNAPDWTIADDNPLWQQLNTLLALLAEEATGRFLACTPSLGGSADVLLNLRGSAELALDVIDQPAQIQAALGAIYPAWRRGYRLFYEAVLPGGAGLLHWHQLWSNRPYLINECDFSALISPRSFKHLFLPDIDRQARTAGRAIFHLDGPDAVRHIDALLALDSLHAIQHTPGAGTPSALAHVPMYRKIHAAGKSTLVFCPFDEVLALCDALAAAAPGANRLAILVEDVPDAASLDLLYAAFCQRFGLAGG